MNFRSLFFVLVALALTSLAAHAGDLIYSGSSTIGTGILYEGAAVDFEKQTGIKFTRIDILGSGKGLKLLTAGGATLAGSSRPLKPEELKAGLIGTVIGYDAIAVFVHKDNPVDNLTKEQLKGIFTGKINNWKEVGGADAPINPNTEILTGKRATVEMFQDAVMDGAKYGKGFKEIELPRDQIIELASNPNGICSVSLGLLAWTSKSVTNRVKVLAVDGVEPKKKTVLNKKYLISRPLLLVTKGAPKEESKKFIDYMLTPAGQAIVARNFVPLR